MSTYDYANCGKLLSFVMGCGYFATDSDIAKVKIELIYASNTNNH